MFDRCVSVAMKRAIFTKLEDATYFGEIPAFPGVWSNANSVEECEDELEEVLEDWLLLKGDSGG